MRHHVSRDWIKTNDHLIIDCDEVYQWISYKKIKPEHIKIADVVYTEIDTIEKNDLRYKLANLNLPGIVVKSMKNPSEKPYRMIDGRHRLKKSMDNNKNSILVYVISEDQAHKFIKQYQ